MPNGVGARLGRKGSKPGSGVATVSGQDGPFASLKIWCKYFNHFLLCVLVF